MLQPVTILPLAVSSAAPTRKFEYVAMARVRASRAASTSRWTVASESLKDALQERDELVPHAAGRLNHLFFSQRLREDAGRHVRDARNAQHLDAHVAGRDRFRHGRHADSV